MVTRSVYWHGNLQHMIKYYLALVRINCGKFNDRKKETDALFSVNQQASSSSTPLSMVQDIGDSVQTIASIIAQCDHQFSASMTTLTNTTLIKGHIGSLATVKFVNQGKLQ